MESLPKLPPEIVVDFWQALVELYACPECLGPLDSEWECGSCGCIFGEGEIDDE